MSKNANSQSETKNTIIKSATAVICVASICLSANSAVAKYSDSIERIAKAGANPSAVSTIGSSSYDTTSYNDTYDSSTDSPSVDSDNATEIPTSSDNNSTSVSDTTDKNTADSNSPASDSNDPTKYSVAQIVNYYNESLKKTYALPKLTIEKTEEVKIGIDEFHPGGELVANLGNKIINKYATENTYTDSFTNGKSNSGGDDAQEFSFHANLDPNGAKTASVKKVGNGYEINITVKPEKATLESRPLYNSQCANPLDLASVDLFGLKITQADFNYPGTTLKAVVDSQGRVTSAASYMPMNGSGAGKLGITGGATVHGSFAKSAKFSF